MPDLTTNAPRARTVDVRKVVSLAMLCAISYVVMYLSKLVFAPITVAGFLTFDLKDVIIAIGGFIFGPLSALLVSLVVSLIEMVTLSDTGPIGLLMNVLSTVAFVCPAAFLYQRRHTLSWAVAGLVIGGLLMTIIMLLWNYLITPMYMRVSRELVSSMLLPIFLPFNLIKAVMNGALTMVLYKPIVNALRKARLIAEPKSASKSRGLNPTIPLLGILVLGTGLLLALVLAGKL